LDKINYKVKNERLYDKGKIIWKIQQTSNFN